MLKVAKILVGSTLLLAGCNGGDGTTGTGALPTAHTTTAATETTSTGSGHSTITAGNPSTRRPVSEIEMPSGNIRCDARVESEKDKNASMRCFIHEMAGPDLPRPKWAMCDWDGGHSFSLARKGPGRLASFCDAQEPPSSVVTLEYGIGWTDGPFTCLSSLIGLLCTNSAGHGLFLSRERQDGF